MTTRSDSHQRPCPHCGGPTIYTHVFWGENSPTSVPSAWVHICGRCRFMARLTGDREADRKRENLLAPTDQGDR